MGVIMSPVPECVSPEAWRRLGGCSAWLSGWISGPDCPWMSEI